MVLVKRISTTAVSTKSLDPPFHSEWITSQDLFFDVCNYATELNLILPVNEAKMNSLDFFPEYQ